MAGGLALAAAGFALLTQVDARVGPGARWSTGSVHASRSGLAPVFTLATDLVVGAAPPERAGAASAISETGAELGGALGIAVLGSIGTAVYRGQMADAVPAGVPPEAAEAARDTLGGAVAAAADLPAAAAGRRRRRLRRRVPGGRDRGRGADGGARSAGGAPAQTGYGYVSHHTQEGPMFRDTRAFSGFAVPDTDAAKDFYGETLGLEVTEEERPADACTSPATGRSLIYPKPDHEPANYTILNFPVADIDRAVDDLPAAGVEFELYSGDLETDEKGIFRKAGPADRVVPRSGRQHPGRPGGARPHLDFPAMELPPGLRDALELPLADALMARRSRRFGLGMTLPTGPLAHASEAEPVPLSELEEAVLVWLGTGVTGLALGDLPPDGLSWMHRWIGRSWPCSVNSHSTELFFTNDAGLHVARLRGREPRGGGGGRARRRPTPPTRRRR